MNGPPKGGCDIYKTAPMETDYRVDITFAKARDSPLATGERYIGGQSVSGFVVLRNFADKKPSVGDDVFVDESAIVIGDVRLLEGASVWPGALLRADDDYIEIGRGSAMMDLSFAEAPKGRPVVVGDRCIVSHAARLHGCSVGSESLVGIGAIILDGAELGERSIVAAGSVLTPGTRIPPESLVMGMPGKVIRETTSSDFTYLATELKALERKARTYRLQK